MENYSNKNRSYVIVAIIVVTNPRKILNLCKDNNKTKIPSIYLVFII